MSAINPGKVTAWTEPATGVRQDKELTLGALSLQEPDAVAITGGSVLGSLVASGATQAIAAAGAISLDANHVKLTGPASSTYAVTLAAPTRAGQLMAIQMIATTSTNSVTLALTNVIGGTQATTATFDAANETLVLISVTGKWVVLKEHGVTLS